LYIINDSNYFIFYNIIVKGTRKYKSFNGKTEPNIKEKITAFEINLLPDNFEITVQILFFDRKEFDPIKPLHKEIGIKTFKFYKKGTYKENDFFDEDAYIIPVFESAKTGEFIAESIKNTDFDKVIKEKKENKIKHKKKKEQKNIKEVDLHIHELLDDDSGMSDYEKLQYQLDVFRKEMKTAIKEGYRRIVFIHGVGSGSLKLKIRNELQQKYKQYKFQDASFREYGYGATMVLLRK
ncbi:MAG: DUF2027 domain-containing protein, partial [Chlorobi bacterium]|nr:DUF2027 domain-containing protein [Chlorobiota bacterium]